jgi:hypothetical protein
VAAASLVGQELHERACPVLKQVVMRANSAMNITEFADLCISRAHKTMSSDSPDGPEAARDLRAVSPASSHDTGLLLLRLKT